jgi:phage-related tail fiber protein
MRVGSSLVDVVQLIMLLAGILALVIGISIVLATRSAYKDMIKTEAQKGTIKWGKAPVEAPKKRADSSEEAVNAESARSHVT